MFNVTASFKLVQMVITLVGGLIGGVLTLIAMGMDSDMDME